MAKRLTDTNKYKKQFIRNLPGAYKLLWDYICLDCDHAGIWIKDFEIAQTYIGKDMPVSEDEALKLFNADEERIIVTKGGSKWFIKPFIDFQYGELIPTNRVHQSVLKELKKCGVDEKIKPLASPLQEAKDNNKDKDKDKDKEKEKEKGVQGEKPKVDEVETAKAEEIIRVWNRNFKNRSENPQDLNLQYAVVSCLHSTSRHTLPQHITEAIKNYKTACELPDSQAWSKYRFHAFITKKIDKYWPETFNAENFKKSNFEGRASPAGKTKAELSYEKAKAELQSQGIL